MGKVITKVKLSTTFAGSSSNVNRVVPGFIKNINPIPLKPSSSPQNGMSNGFPNGS
jgi:hypothetical protein